MRGTDYRRDLRAIRPYIRDLRPVLVGVDGGGDALLEAGLKPDLIIGDMDSASDQVLTCGAELVVHAYRDGTAPGRERLERLGLDHKVLPAPGTSQDVAMLVAFERGARLIVTRRLALQPDRVPRQGPRGHVLDVPDPAARRRHPRRHQGRQPPLPAGPEPPARCCCSCWPRSSRSSIVVLSSPQIERLIDLLWLKLQVLLEGN